MRIIQIIATTALVGGALVATNPAQAQGFGIGIGIGVWAGPLNPGYYASNYYPYSRQVIYHQPYGGVYYGAPPRLVKRKVTTYVVEQPPRQYYVTGYHGHGPSGYGHYSGYQW